MVSGAGSHVEKPLPSRDDRSPLVDKRQVNAPWNRFHPDVIFSRMNLLFLIIVLVILFGGGGFYYGGPAYGGGGLGLVLLVCLIVYLFGGFRSKG